MPAIAANHWPITPQARVGLVLWLAAMVGVAIVSLTVIPQLLGTAGQTVSVEFAVAASMVQSGVLLALAAACGAALAPSVGLDAPVTRAWITGGAIWPALRRQLLPAALGGLAVGALLVLLSAFAPVALANAAATLDIPFAAKALYGGITEEILMRWGLMTLLVWLPWRLIQKGPGALRDHWFVCAALVSALLFGIGHVPVVVALGIEPTPGLVAYIVAGNAIPAVVFGWLYWRRGLEAACMAHALAHLVAVLAA